MANSSSVPLTFAHKEGQNVFTLSQPHHIRQVCQLVISPGAVCCFAARHIKEIDSSYCATCTIRSFSCHCFGTLKKKKSLSQGRCPSQEAEHCPLPFWIHNGRHSACPAGWWKLQEWRSVLVVTLAHKETNCKQPLR